MKRIQTDRKMRRSRPRKVGNNQFCPLNRTDVIDIQERYSSCSGQTEAFWSQVFHTISGAKHLIPGMSGVLTKRSVVNS
jgi:hypothetical protein